MHNKRLGFSENLQKATSVAFYLVLKSDNAPYNKLNIIDRKHMMISFSQYRAIFTEYDWHSDKTMFPANVAEWLCHTDSLTQKLQQIFPNLQVEIVQQGWQAVENNEKFAKISPNATAWVREVLLKSGETPLIFAQTILPQPTIENVAQAVLGLGEQPIGLWLFPQSPQRKSLEWRQDPQTKLYARRSELSLKGYPLEIRELFLAEFPFEDCTIKA